MATTVVRFHCDEAMTNNDFGKYMENLRESRGFGVNQLAKKSGVSGSEVSRIESGERKRPHPDVLLKIAKALRHPVEDFYVRLGYLNDVSSEESVPAPILARIKELAKSANVDFDNLLNVADVSESDLAELDTDDPDPHILWPVAQILRTNMSYLAGLTDRVEPILGPGQALHDSENLYRPASELHPEDAWDLEQAFFEKQRRRAANKKKRDHK